MLLTTADNHSAWLVTPSGAWKGRLCSSWEARKFFPCSCERKLRGNTRLPLISIRGIFSLSFCVYVYVYVGTCVHTEVIQRGQRSTLGVITHEWSPNVLRHCLLLVWSSPSKLGHLVSKPQRPACPHLPSAGITSVSAQDFLYGPWGSNSSFQLIITPAQTEPKSTQPWMGHQAPAPRGFIIYPACFHLTHVFLFLVREELSHNI